jgi:hypothetical protein
MACVRDKEWSIDNSAAHLGSLWLDSICRALGSSPFAALAVIDLCRKLDQSRRPRNQREDAMTQNEQRAQQPPLEEPPPPPAPEKQPPPSEQPPPTPSEEPPPLREEPPPSPPEQQPPIREHLTRGAARRHFVGDD